jgi:hypothetical protein
LIECGVAQRIYRLKALTEFSDGINSLEKFGPKALTKKQVLPFSEEMFFPQFSTFFYWSTASLTSAKIGKIWKWSDIELTFECGSLVKEIIFETSSF